MKSALVSARHGSYDSNRNLNAPGKEQMRRLATAVQGVINGYDLQVSLLCSTAPRAQQGARIITDILQIPEDRVTFHECLWDDNQHRGDYGGARKLIESFLKDGSMAMFLSHIDMATLIANVAAKKLATNGRATEIGYGEGLLVTTGGIFVIPG